MPPVAYTCPKCRAVLKSANAFPAGKAIKCPKCANIFVPAVTGPNAPARPSGPAAPRPGAMPVQKSRPSAQGVPPRKRRKFPRLLVTAGFLVLFLGVCGGGGWFVWSSYGSSILAGLGLKPSAGTEVAGENTDKDKPKSTAPIAQPAAPVLDPLAYIPAESTAIFGLGLGSLLAEPTVAAFLDPVLKRDQDMKMFEEIETATGLNYKIISDQTLMGLKVPIDPTTAVGGVEHMTAVYVSKKPFPPDKVIPVLSNGPARKVNGRDWYPTSKSPPFTSVLVANNRTLVFTNVGADRLETVFTSDGKKPLPPAETMAMVRRVEKNQVWVVVPVNDMMRTQMDKTLQPLQPNIPPEFKAAFDALLRVKGVALWGGLEGTQVKLSLALACADDKAAQEVVAGLQGAWDKHAKPAIDTSPIKDMLAGLPPYTQTTVKELLGNKQFKRQENLAQLTLQVSLSPLETLVKEAMNNPAVLAEAFKPPAPADPSLAKEQAELVKLTNEFRVKNQQPPHRLNKKLEQAAQAYAQKMAKQGKRDAVVDIQGIADAAKAAGYQYQTLNAAIASGPGATAQSVMNLWATSEPIKQVILDKQFEEVGVGVARDDKGESYVVQVYATHQK